MDEGIGISADATFTQLQLGNERTEYSVCLGSYSTVESYARSSSMLLHQCYGIATLYKYSGKAQIRIELGPATEAESASAYECTFSSL